jgi:hypothetical protein
MHIIHDIAFDVDVHYTNSSVSWEQYYVDFIQERLLPRVERICDDWDRKHPNAKCVIENIDISVDVDTIDLEALQKEILQQLSQQLVHIQSDGKNSEGIVVATITKEASPMDGLLAYLEKGVLPAHISVKAFKEWLGAVSDFTSVEENALRSLFVNNTNALARMLSLLRNDYAKLSKLITNTQQITAQYVKLEESFFQLLLETLCAQFKLTYKAEEASIWFKTLGFSSSLPQFSKTFLQLFASKATVANKVLKNVDQRQFSLLVLQAITQYETNKTLNIEVSNIATITTGSVSKKTTPEEVDRKEAFQKEKEAQKAAKVASTEAEKHSKTKEGSQQEETASTTQQKETSSKNNASTKTQKQDDNPKQKDQNTVEASTKETHASDLAKANTQNAQASKNTTASVTRKPVATDITLTTEKAGLVLLHPFLSRFFQGIGLLTDDNEIKDIGRACMLLHYLATETEEVTDIELSLEKVLLGIPQETVIDYQTPLSEDDKKGCVELLEAVLEHWVVLKKSTINTLRDMFLKRDGQLTITENSLKLSIESAAQDILLDKIPWNISIFRLKWMEKMMHIEW